MSDEDDDFLDAKETLQQVKNEQNGAEHRPRPAALPVPAPRRFSASSTPRHAQDGQEASTSRHVGSVSVARRDRLTALRNRMRDEFGAREITPTVDIETASVMSDATSLHSWHRRVLAGPDSEIILPSDSASTRAASVLWSPQVREQHRFEPVPEDQSVPSPLSPQDYLPMSPPPTEPPPPLPTLELRPPPPLPPRNPSIRLPDPVVTEPVADSPSTDSPRTNSFTPPPQTTTVQDVILEEELDVKTSDGSLSGGPLRAQRLSTNSTDSICSATDNSSGKRRGHVKTNSLDRGLSLAKSIKSGPFPPPSNKTNSLTRQETVLHEEEERNTEADCVIRQITTSVIPEKGAAQGALERTASASSSVSSPSSHPLNGNRRSTVDGPPVDTIHEEMKVRSESVPEEFFVPVVDAYCPPSASASHTTSLDPISRDVERRMSMKRDGTFPKDFSDDDSASANFATRSTLGQAKVFARTATNYASGFFRGALQKVKGVTHLGSQESKEGEEETSDSEGEQSETGTTTHPVNGIVRPRKAKKGPFDFEQMKIVQELNNEHTGAVWCIKFSACGRLVATAGTDCILRVWCVTSHIHYFQEMRERHDFRYQQKTEAGGSPADVMETTLNDLESFRAPSSSDSQPPTTDTNASETAGTSSVGGPLFASKPFAVFKGHTADILDISWSKNYFILSSGMDRTVKLWHLSRNECLCCFQHVDFVTSVSFLPKDDRYFLSASLDGKLRLWHIPDKKVAVWNEVTDKLITAMTFVKNGKFLVVGTYYGRCYFYTSDLKYHTVIDVRSTRGKNARGHKVTGLAVHGDKLLVTSNDSRIRMYDIRDKALTCKFRGAQHERSQIRAAFSPDGKHIICGSEDKFIYIWRTADMPLTLAVRKDRNAMWERVRAHTAAVTVAVFAPKPQVFLSTLERKSEDRALGHVIVSADLNGGIKIFLNRPKLTKAGQSTFFSGSSSE